ncbi:MAG TPA: hypothetical protein VIQ74_10165 [Gemmatimonadaceae bacterium]
MEIVLTGVIDFSALRERFAADCEVERQGKPGVVESRLARALDAIGWRSAGGESSGQVAILARHIVASCVAGHHDPRRAARELAGLLRSASAGLDGGLPAPSAFVPAAEDVLRRYAGTGSAT